MTQPKEDNVAELVVHNLQGARGDRVLFSDLSFRLRPAEFLHITGPNGSGKTTLLRIVCGLLSPERGEIRWRGRDIRKVPTQYRMESTYVGHRDGLKAELTALENLDIAARLYGGGINHSLDDCIRVLGLRQCQDLMVAQLSAGQRRRLALGRLLVKNAILWILDEPFTAIDDQGRDVVEAHLISHLEQGGMVVLTSHQPVSHPRLRECCITVSL